MSDSLSEKYSKWDHLVVSSDDEDDCHPNIDIKLWKRLQKEKRERERTEQDDHIEALRARIDAKIEEWKKEIEKIEKAKLLTVEDLSTTTEELTIIGGHKTKKTSKTEGTKVYSRPKSKTKKSGTVKPGPKPPKDLLPVPEAYGTFREKHSDALAKYLNMHDAPPLTIMKFLESNIALLCQECTGWLIMKALEQEMTGKNRKRTKRIVRMYLIVQSVLDFTAQSGRPVIESLRRLFDNMINRSHDFEEHMKAEIEEFTMTVAKRAEVKLKKLAEDEAKRKKEEESEKKKKEEEKNAKKEDPMKVFMELPQQMQDAFRTRNLKLLNEFLCSVEPEKARELMERCRRAGLWTPSEEKKKDDDDNKKETQEYDRNKALDLAHQDVSKMSIKDLKALIQLAGLKWSDCREKKELRERAREAQSKIAGDKEEEEEEEKDEDRRGCVVS
eukprot:g953.t1